MKLEDVTAEIRPRTDWEAVDLGFAMVRRDFWRCYIVWWLALLGPAIAAGWFLQGAPLLLIPLLWWLKPIGSRMVLFELSRRLFGEKPTWGSVFRQIPAAWTRRFFYRIVWARFSPWLPVMLAVEDLEGLRRASYGKRASQLALRGDGVVMWIFLLADAAAAWVSISLFLLAVTLLPEGLEGPWRLAAETFDMGSPQDIPPVISWTAVGCTMIGMSLTDLFVIGAGFGIYVNNRTWLEGWDVELAFKRLGKRLTGIAAVLAIVCSVFFAPVARAQYEERTDAEVIREVKSHPDFKVHEEIRKIPKEKSKSKWPSFSGMEQFTIVIGYALLVILIGLIIWLIWRHRHVFQLKRSGEKIRAPAPVAKVVMGMQVTAESLPKDIPARVLALWREGKHHEALALLYRGTISKVIDASRVEIQESDTEGDCLRRVIAAGNAAHPGYFGGLTETWMRLAYAGLLPADADVVSLCSEWPYVERGRA